MGKLKEFTTIENAAGKYITFHDITGLQYVEAMVLGGGNPGAMMKILILKTIYLDGNPITEDDLDAMQAWEVVEILQTLSLLLQQPIR